jgi:hypothetical protein
VQEKAPAADEHGNYPQGEAQDGRVKWVAITRGVVYSVVVSLIG